MRNSIPKDLVQIWRVPADDAAVRAAAGDWNISEQESAKILDACQSLKDYQGINPLEELCKLAENPMSVGYNDAAPGGPPA